MRNAVVRWLTVAAYIACSPALAQDYVPVNLQLLTAARAGDLAAVQRLIGDGAAINARNRLGETPLVIALKRGHDALAVWLVAQTARVQQANTDGLTAAVADALDG